MKKSFLCIVVLAFALAGCGEPDVSEDASTSQIMEETNQVISGSESIESEPQQSEAAESEVNDRESDAVSRTEESGVEESSSAEEKEEAIMTVAEKLEFVSTENSRIGTVLNDSGTYNDGVGNSDSYIYQIPQFFTESGNANAVNERIVQELSEIIDVEYKCMGDGVSLHVPSVIYRVMEYGDVITLLVAVDYQTDFIDYYTYSYHFGEDRELTNTDLLAMNGMSEDAFVEEACRQAREVFAAFVKEVYPDMTEEEMTANMVDSIEGTTVNLPMYYDESGTLNAYVPVASIAGNSWYFQLFQF